MRKAKGKLSRLIAGCLSVIMTFGSMADTCFAEEMPAEAEEQQIVSEETYDAEEKPAEEEVSEAEELPEEEKEEDPFYDPELSKEDEKELRLEETMADETESADGDYGIRPVRISASTFPDPIFRSYVSSTFDKNGDGTLDSDELLVARNIWCDHMGIRSLDGIEYLVELRGVYASFNELTELDLSKNPEITGVWVSNNKFTKLDFRANADTLEWLYCFDNPTLRVLNLDGCTKMSYLECSECDLRELDVSKFPLLEHLICASCGLDELDLSHNPKLGHLDAFNNPDNGEDYPLNNHLTHLDLSHNPKMKRLDIWANRGLKFVDTSYCPGLQYYNCAFINADHVDVSKNPELTKLNVSYNKQIKSLDLSHNPKLFYLDCADNQITNLDLSHNNKLHFLQAFINDFTTLDIGYNPLLIKTYKEGVTEDVFGIATQWSIDYGIDDSTSGDSKYVLSFDDDVKLLSQQKYQLPDTAEVIIPDGVTNADLIRREEAVQTLYNMAGKPRPSISRSRFTDVKSGAWYEDALLWGQEHNIAFGTPDISDNKFGIGEWVTRQDVAVMLMRYAETQNYERAIDFGRSDDFIDYYDIDYYAWEGVTWACTWRIMEGKGAPGAPKEERYIYPHHAATRKDFKEMIARMFEVNHETDSVPDIYVSPDPVPSAKDINSCKLTLKSKNLYYTGRNRVPAVTVYDGNTKLVRNTDYKLVYSNNREPGRASVTVQGINRYTGTATLNFNIRTVAVKQLTAAPTANSVKLTWSTTHGANGYKVYQYNAAKRRYDLKATIKDPNATSYTISGLSGKTTYIFKIKGYASVGTTNYPGAGKKVEVKTK